MKNQNESESFGPVSRTEVFLAAQGKYGAGKKLKERAKALSVINKLIK